MVLILGIALISPRFVGPAARLVAAPIERSTKLVGRLARENSTRAPRAHRGHLGRADDRPRARRLRDDVRQRAARLGRGPDRPHARRRHRGAPRRRLLADPGGDRTGGGEGRRRHGRVVAAGTRRPRSRASTATSNTHAIEPATLREVYNFDWVEGSDDTLRSLGDDGVLLEEATADRGQARGRRPHRGHRPERQRRAHGARHLQGRRVCSAASSMTGRVVRPHRRAEAGHEHPRQDGRGCGRARGAEARRRGARRLPRGARPLAGGAQGGERRPGQPGPRRCSTRCWR